MCASSRRAWDDRWTTDVRSGRERLQDDHRRAAVSTDKHGLLSAVMWFFCPYISEWIWSSEELARGGEVGLAPGVTE